MLLWMISDGPAVRSCRLVLLLVIHLVVTTVSEKVSASDEYDFIRDGTASKEKRSSSRRPNTIYIFQDDLGFGDLSCYGHPCDLTPNLGRLAAEGTMVRNFHVSGVTCNPSRTGFMTSRHPATFPKLHGVLWISGRSNDYWRTEAEWVHNGPYRQVGHRS